MKFKKLIISLFFAFIFLSFISSNIIKAMPTINIPRNNTLFPLNLNNQIYIDIQSNYLDFEVHHMTTVGFPDWQSAHFVPYHYMKIRQWITLNENQIVFYHFRTNNQDTTFLRSPPIFYILDKNSNLTLSWLSGNSYLIVSDLPFQVYYSGFNGLRSSQYTLEHGGHILPFGNPTYAREFLLSHTYGFYFGNNQIPLDFVNLVPEIPNSEDWENMFVTPITEIIIPSAIYDDDYIGPILPPTLTRALNGEIYQITHRHNDYVYIVSVPNGQHNIWWNPDPQKSGWANVRDLKYAPSPFLTPNNWTRYPGILPPSDDEIREGLESLGLGYYPIYAYSRNRTPLFLRHTQEGSSGLGLTDYKTPVQVLARFGDWVQVLNFTNENDLTLYWLPISEIRFHWLPQFPIDFEFSDLDLEIDENQGWREWITTLGRQATQLVRYLNENIQQVFNNNPLFKLLGDVFRLIPRQIFTLIFISILGGGVIRILGR